MRRILFVGAKKINELEPAFKYMKNDFSANVIIRNRNNIKSHVEFFLKVIKLIGEEKRRKETKPIFLIIQDFSLSSFLLTVYSKLYRKIWTIFRLRSLVVEEYISVLRALRIRRIVNLPFQIVILLLVDSIFCISQYQMKRIRCIPRRKKYFVPIISCPYEGDVVLRFEKESPRKPYKLVLVSNFTHLKKTQGTLDIIKIISEDEEAKDLILDIYGKGRYAGLVIKAADDMNNVSFNGYTSDVKGVLEAADAFIYGSYLESFGATTLEARLAGLPIFVLDYPSLREQAYCSKSILHLEEEDFSITKKIDDHLSRNDWRRVAREDYARARNQHSPISVAERLRKILNDIGHE